MQGIKFVLVAALAICASQCQAAEYPISADKVDLRLLVENGAAIAKHMFKAVNTGLNESKPHLDKILNELAPEAKALLKKIIDEARAKLTEEEKRITHIFATLIKALDRLKPIKSCYDKVSPAAKKLALATEKEIANIVVGVQNKYKKEIENVRVGTQKIIQKARNLFDKEVEEVIKCLTPGRKDAGECMNKAVDRIVEGAVGVVLDTVILSQTAAETLKPIVPEVVQKLLPLVEKTTKDGKVILKSLTDCVSALK